MASDEQKRKWKEYYQKNREKKLAKVKQYNKLNADKIRLYQNEYYKLNPRKKNKELTREYFMEYFKAYRLKIRA